jgi:cell division protein FtsZ
MRDAGYAHMGVGMATGRDKAEIAARMAVTSPLLETSISGATGILINITASPDISLDEVETASAMISNEAHPDANIIWGAAFDNTLEDTIKITVIATGFKSEEKTVVAPAQSARPATTYTSNAQPVQPVQQPAQTIKPENKDSLISDNDFEDIMNILRKNRG